MSMTVIHYIGKGQAMIEVECVAKEFSNSIRFMLCDGKTVTIKRKDILSIEKHEDENESIYQINCDGTGKNRLTIENVQIGKFFGGYDFMGSVEWVDSAEDAYRMEIEEAKQIISDLESSDEPMAKDEPKTMKRIEVLRALAAAHSAFWAELKKYGIEMGTWEPGKPYTLYIDNGPTKPNTILGEYDYKQKVSKNL